jgi:hypothetical protein
MKGYAYGWLLGRLALVRQNVALTVAAVGDILRRSNGGQANDQ